MYIKYVIIKKFKSYRELTYMEELSPEVNLVLGANGQGKSNFIDAIIFVLTDKYNGIRQEDKKFLLHEEPGETSNEISVELIIDNKSRKFPIDKDIISFTKIYRPHDNIEEYIVNQRKILKADANNLLESAGFLKIDPYYIIQQGRISNIINMTDENLFELFTEVTGTKTYEDKKTESLKIFEEAKDNKHKILKQNEEIKLYIFKLESQCDQLKDFEIIEKEQKACEFFIYQEKISDYQVNLDILQARINENKQDLGQFYSTENIIKKKKNEKLIEVDTKKQRLKYCKVKLESLDNELNNLQNKKIIKNVSTKTNIERKEALINKKRDTFEKIINLRKDIDLSNKELQIIKKKVTDINDVMKTIQFSYSKLNDSSELYLLRQNGSFISEKEKKEYIMNELKKINKLKEDINQKIISMSNIIEKDDEEIKNFKNKTKIIDEDCKSINEELKENNIIFEMNQLKKIENSNEIRKIMLEINSLNKDIENCNENIKISHDKLPNHELLEMILKIKDNNFEGFYGTLLDMINIESKFKYSCDIIAKDKLFSLIVRDYSTAQTILEFNKKNNGPVLTILPLDWNKDNRKLSYPSSSEILPLVKFISIKDNLKGISEDDILPIVNKVFGKTLIVKSYDIGVKFAKETKMNCITPDNEVIYSGGFVTKVGYYDFKRERSGLYNDVIENKKLISVMESEKKNFDERRFFLQNSETKLLRDMQELFSKKKTLMANLENKNQELHNISEETVNLSSLIVKKKEMLDSLFEEKKINEDKIKAYNNILINKDLSKLTDEDIKQLESVNVQKVEMENQLLELQRSLNSILQKKAILENKINDELLKQENDLNKNLKELSIEEESLMGITDTIKNNEDNYNNIDLEKYEIVINDRKNCIIKVIKQLEIEIESIRKEIESFSNEELKVSEKVSKEESSLNTLILQLNSLASKKEEFLKKIGILGQIQPELIDKLIKLKNQQINLHNNESSISIDVKDPDKVNKFLEPIFLKLDKLNKSMKNFEKINRFALEDYQNFTKKREEIKDYLIDLEKKEKEIFNVLKTLDENKDKAILNTFQIIKQNFITIFKDIVPNGFADLKLYNKYSENSQISQENGKSNSVQILVSFSGNPNYLQSMNQLSGGQKTAVAISLIFAISKVEPPPFYILDEVDSALDPNFRNNLSKLIGNLSKNNQFLITTFKPELIDCSQNIYQTRFQNKTSNLLKINKENAANLIKEITNK